MRYKINNFNEGITVTQGLIAVNVIIFLNMNLSGDDFFGQIVLQYASTGWFDLNVGWLRDHSFFDKGEYYRLLTANFLHAHIPHLLMNMYGLHILGQYAEYMMGKKNFIIVYLICAIGSTFLSALVDVFMQESGLVLGASGAILGIAGALAGISIYRKVNNIYRGIQLDYQQLLMALGLNVVLGLVPGISFMGHLGGALTGLAVGFVYAFLIEKKIIR